jgi:hypothetical protein
MQVHGVDFYSGSAGELSVEVYKSVKERLKRTSPDVEFRCMRTSKPKSGALVDERKSTTSFKKDVALMFQEPQCDPLCLKSC